MINFRSEGRKFPKGRCLVPASHFYEFTGKRSPKTKWQFTKAGEDWFCFAGLWRPMPDGQDAAFTLLTTEPGPDVAPIHDRQMVILKREDWSAWLDLTRPEAELLQPLQHHFLGPAPRDARWYGSGYPALRAVACQQLRLLRRC